MCLIRTVCKRLQALVFAERITAYAILECVCGKRCVPLKGKSASIRKCCFPKVQLAITNPVKFYIFKKLLYSKFDLCFFGLTASLISLKMDVEYDSDEQYLVYTCLQSEQRLSSPFFPTNPGFDYSKLFQYHLP